MQLLHFKQNSLTGIVGVGWGLGGERQCFASPAIPRPPVEQVRRASYVWSPETYKDIQAQFMNISRYVPELHNIVTPSIAFLSQHPTPTPTPLSLCRAQGHPFKASLHQVTSVPWGAYTDRVAGIEVRDRRKSLWGFFLSDDESLRGFLWRPHFSLLWVWWQRPVFKWEIKDF